MKYALAVAYVGTVILTNIVFSIFGLQPVWPGILAPSAVFVAGLAFIIRDYLHRAAGARWCIAAILVGAIVSALISPALALASGAAFLFSELADLAVFTPLRRRGFVRAVVISNAVGILVDSIIFLALAYGSFSFLPGQLIGKAYATVVFLLWSLVVLAATRRREAVPQL